MAYNEQLADRVREALEDVPNVEEKKMFRGVTFMVNDKMCVSVSNDELMCRIDPDLTDEVAEMNGVRPMVMRGKTLKGYVYVAEEAIRTKKDFDYWIDLCLAYNPKANKSKK
jgi:TfoX/Sxy family transcriptional regulator of competence genes